MSDTIKARKGKLTKKFHTNAWELLGKNKNGWIEVSDTNQLVENEVKNPPPSGEKEKTTSDTNQLVENEVNDTKQTQTVGNEVKNTVADTEFSGFVKENLSKADIKDYFDVLESKDASKKVPYKNDMNLQALTDLLIGVIGNDIEKLKSEFNISGL